MLTYLKFRWQRIVRRWIRAFVLGWQSTRDFWRQNLWGKWSQLAMVRRFAVGWWAIVLVMAIGLVWQTRQLAVEGSVLQPLPGGSYSEGVAGSIKTINPILPDNSASADAVRLVFNGLTRFDTNGNLKSDLAKDWTVSPDGKTYTFKLRRDVVWHDGVPFTSQDVLFTLAAIQNPDTRSPLAPSWQGIKADAPDEYTVVYTLPRAYTPFINATTVGILPRHLLEGVEPSTMRVAPFNLRPVGTGPFQIDPHNGSSEELVLKANPKYYRGKPLLQSITLRSYPDLEQAYIAYTRRQVKGVARIQPAQLETARKSGTMRLHEAGVPDQVGVFFKTTTGVTADKAVRTALSQATDRQAIIDSQFGGTASGLADPIVSDELNLVGAPHQASYNQDQASSTLDAAGWTKGSDGIRQKDGKKLELEVVTQSNTDYVAVAHQLAGQWEKIGVKIKVTEVDAAKLQQSYIRPRKYDAILYGVNVGADPDVYAFWHSSQASDPGLNLSSYNSTAADKALEAGRTIRDQQTRSAKYRSFLQSWVADAPAVLLYTPSYIYGVDREVHGVHLKRLITPSDRFADIEQWSVRVKAVPGH